MQSKRAEIRNMCADVLEVRWNDTHGKVRRSTALLEDISPSGACLQVESEIPVGVRIRWECQNQPFAGRIRYCTFREIGYFAGVEFEAGVTWSKQTYTPRHLLELERLVSQAKR